MENSPGSKMNPGCERIGGTSAAFGSPRPTWTAASEKGAYVDSPPVPAPSICPPALAPECEFISARTLSAKKAGIPFVELLLLPYLKETHQLSGRRRGGSPIERRLYEPSAIGPSSALSLGLRRCALASP